MKAGGKQYKKTLKPKTDKTAKQRKFNFENKWSNLKETLTKKNLLKGEENKWITNKTRINHIKHLEDRKEIN